MAYTTQQLNQYSNIDAPTANALMAIQNGSDSRSIIANLLGTTDPYAINQLSNAAGLGNFIASGSNQNSKNMASLWSSPQAQQLAQYAISKYQPALQSKADSYFANPSAYSPNNNSSMQAYDQTHNSGTDAAQASAFGDVSRTQASPLQAQTQSLNNIQSPISDPNSNNISTQTSMPNSTTSSNVSPQITALNQGATPTTNNGVGNSTTGSQLTAPQTSASFGNISNPQTPQDAQRTAMKVDPNNITGYQTGITNSGV